MSANYPGSIAPDGFVSSLGGMDAGVQPNLIRDNQYANGVNVTMQDGTLATRPGFIKRNQSFATDLTQTQFQCFNPQGFKYYQVGERGYLISVIGGRVYYTDPENGFSTTEIPAGTPNSADEPKAYMIQAEDYFIIQDGYSKPIIINGLTAARAGDKQVPVGTAMAYGWGRLWVARGNEFVAGDIQGGPTKLIDFTDTTYFAEGGAFKLPSTCGQLTGMAFIPLQDTATGQGQLLVGGEYGIASVQGGIPREQWKNTQIQQISQLDVGFTGQDSNALLNGDIFYRSFDGIRSYRMARAQQGINGNTTQSQEVIPYVNTDTQQFLKYASAVYFNGRVLMTTNPVFKGTYCYWKGLLSLNSQPQSSIAQKAPPVWEGVWTGLNIVQITKGIFNRVERCFALVRSVDDTIIDTITGVTATTEFNNNYEIRLNNPDRFEAGKTYMDLQTRVYFRVDSVESSSIFVSLVNPPVDGVFNIGDAIVRGEYNEIWEISKNSPFDVIENENRLIQSKVWTRSFTHGSPLNQKRLSQGGMWTADIIGTVNWSVSYRPDQEPCMFPWRSGQLCAQLEVCGEQCPTTLTRHPGYKTKILFGSPDAVCIPQQDRLSNLGYEFQWLIEWEGHMKIRAAQEICENVVEDVKARLNC